MINFSTKQAQWLVGIFLCALIIEAITFHFFSILYFFAGVILLYFGFRYKKTSLYVASCIFLLIAFISLITLRIAIVVIAVYYIYHYYKKDKKYTLKADDDLLTVQHNRFIGTDEAVESYAWKDVNIQRLAGIITIDATQTVLPRRSSVITARQLIGNVHIILPYDTPYRLVYTTVYGVATLPHDTKQLKNETLYHQEEDQAAVREIVIHVTTGLGDLEVTYQ